ncbi:hypothetical protein HBA54_07225 [Pelagibius litoralis]|uniref:Uncharacterized protein n=1 Tax=Pelagibius litoralis TaxID=374515 RepID=A0A967C475_9PROT|nr:hypothetical protein [Pelagibius litoralis]NIA68380.1 hypothetical protein [Pelagibius litoralis]
MFRQAFADKVLTSEDMTFTLHADGRISGRIGESLLTGAWYWQDQYFCRTAELDGEDLGLDCEIIERRGHQMRYIRDKGNGEASIVDVGVDVA